MTDSGIHIFTVEEITLYIKQKLTSDENLQDIWIEGEISNFVHHASGHFYFTLKDEDAQLPSAMFKWANSNLKFKLENGMKILARGSIDLYKPQGRYNLVVSEVHPKGAGELYLRFLQLKEKLAKEGLFDVEFKKLIPRFPGRVAVVTSPTGAAIQDIVNIMGRRFPPAEILVVPTLVQGDKAAEDIACAIRLLSAIPEIDVMIVGRGGGSYEDLWPFNEEVVARAIFNSHIPIISAVGHETDFTISDFVADIRAATPSAAAELAVPDKSEIIRHLNGLNNSMAQNLNTLLKMKKTHLTGVTSILKPKLLMDMVVQLQQQSDSFTSKIIMVMDHNLKIYSERFNALSEMLDAVSPLSTLKRGYSIAQKLPEETTLDSIKKAREGDDIKVIVQDGEMKCKVKSVKSGRDFDKTKYKNIHEDERNPKEK